MTALYCRVSTIDQKTDRQRINESEFKIVIEDKCSGGVPFFEREGGKEVKKLVQNQVINTLSVWTIDRLGRDLRDIINTIHYFNENKVCVHFLSQGLSTNYELKLIFFRIEYNKADVPYVGRLQHNWFFSYIDQVESDTFELIPSVDGNYSLKRSIMSVRISEYLRK